MLLRAMGKSKQPALEVFRDFLAMGDDRGAGKIAVAYGK